MNEVIKTQGRFNPEKSIELVIGGTKLLGYVQATVYFDYTEYPEIRYPGGAGEPPYDVAEITSVKLTVTLYGSALGNDEEHCIQFVTNSIEFYEEHFGEIDIDEVFGYVYAE